MVEAAANPEGGKRGDKKKVKTNVGNDVVVRERDFKSKTTHQDTVSGIKRAGNDEFLTVSADCSLKVWDKFTEGVSYTIETHEPLTSM